MNKLLKPNRKLLEFNLLNKTTVLYCSSNSSNEKQPIKSVNLTKYDQKSITGKDMKNWRTPWHEKEGEYYTALQSFGSPESQRYVLQWLQQDFDLSPSGIKRWWAKKKENEALAYQAYLPERNQMLGNELAAAHFIVHRKGAIKFHGDDKWIKADESGNYNLPRRLDSTKYIQAINCDGMELFYEGLVNLANLKRVEWLNLGGCERADDWFLDRISNIFSHSLVYLDLRYCKKITDRGLVALYRMPHLKILYLDDNVLYPRYEMTCLLLQECNPNLDIRMD